MSRSFEDMLVDTKVYIAVVSDPMTLEFKT